MADVHYKEIRSYNMSRIGSKNTKPELVVRKFLFRSGFRYRLHVKTLQGKPDIVLPKFKTVIFVHGCFWHGHFGCKYYSIPKTRTEWWLNKINTNITNDSIAENKLKENGWNVLKVWSCQLKGNLINTTLSDLFDYFNRYQQGLIRSAKKDSKVCNSSLD